MRYINEYNRLKSDNKVNDEIDKKIIQLMSDLFVEYADKWKLTHRILK